MSTTDTPIYVLSVPHMGAPTATWHLDEADYLKQMKFAESSCLVDRTIYAQTTRHALAREVYDTFFEPDAEAVVAFVAAQGPDVPLYRADYVCGRAEDYIADPITEFDAYAAWDGHDLDYHRVLRGADAARAEIAHLRGPNAPRTGKCGPLAAAVALADVLRRSGDDV